MTSALFIYIVRFNNLFIWTFKIWLETEDLETDGNGMILYEGFIKKHIH